MRSVAHRSRLLYISLDRVYRQARNDVAAGTAERSIELQDAPPDVRAHGEFIGSHVGGWMAACLPATRFGRMLSARRHAAVLCQAVACRVRGR